MNKYNFDFVAVPKIYNSLTGNELKLFITLLDLSSLYSNEDGVFFHSYKQLCEKTGMSINTIKTATKSLLNANIISVYHHNDGRKNNSYNKANEYKINYDMFATNRYQNLTPINEKKVSKIDTNRYQNLTEKVSKFDTHIRNNNNNIDISYCSDSTEDNNVEIKEKINKKEIESVVSDNGTNETQHNTSTTNEDMNTNDRETINNLKDEIKRQQDIMYHTQLQETGEQAYNLMCVHMNNLKTLMSNEEYTQYRTHIKNWWKKTKQYFKWQTKKDQADQIAKDKIESVLQGYQYSTDVETAKNMLQVLVNRIENYHGEDVDDIYTTYRTKVNDIRKLSPIHEQAYNIFVNGEDDDQSQTNVTEATETPQIQSQTAQMEQLPTEDNINDLCAHTEDEMIIYGEKPNDADVEIEDSPNIDANLDNRIVNEEQYNEFVSMLDDDDTYIGSPQVA